MKETKKEELRRKRAEAVELSARFNKANHMIEYHKKELARLEKRGCDDLTGVLIDFHRRELNNAEHEAMLMRQTLSYALSEIHKM
jgi:hypothetical protein